MGWNEFLKFKEKKGKLLENYFEKLLNYFVIYLYNVVLLIWYTYLTPHSLKYFSISFFVRFFLFKQNEIYQAWDMKM